MLLCIICVIIILYTDTLLWESAPSLAVSVSCIIHDVMMLISWLARRYCCHRITAASLIRLTQWSGRGKERKRARESEIFNTKRTERTRRNTFIYFLTLCKAGWCISFANPRLIPETNLSGVHQIHFLNTLTHVALGEMGSFHLQCALACTSLVRIRPTKNLPTQSGNLSPPKCNPVYTTRPREHRHSNSW